MFFFFLWLNSNQIQFNFEFGPTQGILVYTLEFELFASVFENQVQIPF
jgi:hypothetical protein